MLGSDLNSGEKSLVVFRQFVVASRQDVDLHFHLVMFSLIATLEATRLVAKSSLQVRHVRPQLIDRSLTVLTARQINHIIITLIHYGNSTATIENL